MTEFVTEFEGIKLLSGPHSHPGSGPAKAHQEEYKIFQKSLQLIKNDNPVMVELGAFWGLWSLCFKQKFPLGKNVLIELGKRQLHVGQKKFELNKLNGDFYWGGVFLSDSGTFQNRINDIDYKPRTNSYWDTHEIKGEKAGPELDLLSIFDQEHIKKIDMLHMDIQGSQLPVIRLLDNKGWLKGNVSNLIVATHSSRIHQEILDILTNKNKFNIVFNCAFGLIGGDGLLVMNHE